MERKTGEGGQGRVPAAVVAVFDLLERSKTETLRIFSGDEGIDAMLGGGIPSNGGIFEVCGSACSA